MMVPGDQLGLYFSIPFCRSKCTYCNFASGVFPAHEHSRYVGRLIDEMRDARKWADSLGVHLCSQVDTIYLGGGTPSLLEPEHIKLLFSSLHNEFAVSSNAEITMECAPGQLSDAVVVALGEVGVNRVSLGVQSFVDREAHQSGRLHTRAGVLEDLGRLRAAGVKNLSIDLIAGLPGQTFASWRESIAVLIETGVPHASIYMLEVDDDSRLGRELLSGGGRYHADIVPSDDTIVRMYEYAIETLAEAGLAQYEISNFARPDCESAHNLRYWQRRPYLGLGLDASSMLSKSAWAPERSLTGDVCRFTSTDDLSTYIEGKQPPKVDWLSSAGRHEEAWFLGLRMNRGVSISALRAEFGNQMVAMARDSVDQLAVRGLIALEGDSVCLTAKGRLLSNDVFQEFLELGITREPATGAPLMASGQKE